MTDLVSKLSPQAQEQERQKLHALSPDDGKYAKSALPLVPFLSPDAEWRMFAKVQRALLATRVEFGQAQQNHLDELDGALQKIDTLNMALLEEQVTKHDQLAVLEELGRHISPETKALLHPGTTSYDVVDTARAILLKGAWQEVLRPQTKITAKKIIDLSAHYINKPMVGRTHLQHTTPVSVGHFLSNYAVRIADRIKKIDDAVNDLRGKIGGIVGTGASIDLVLGGEYRRSIAFEEKVLERLGLKPDYSATQIATKERIADVAHGVVTLAIVNGGFANDIRILYGSDIGELTSLDAAARLGGSSADAGKNNPIDWENIAGLVAVIQAGMPVLYAQTQTDLQRDLRGSVQARYQPAGIFSETLIQTKRMNKALEQLAVIPDAMEENLAGWRSSPTELLTAITRAHGWVHPTLGVGHDAVKTYAKQAKKEKTGLMIVAQRDPEFVAFYGKLSQNECAILKGDASAAILSSIDRAERNVAYVRDVLNIDIL